MNLINKVYSLALGSACLGGLTPAYFYLNKVDTPTEVVETQEVVTPKSSKPSHLEWVKGKLGDWDGTAQDKDISPM